MVNDLLTTYKYGWKTSYYLNTDDGKGEGDVESQETLNSIIEELNNTEEDDCESCKI